MILHRIRLNVWNIVRRRTDQINQHNATSSNFYSTQRNNQTESSPPAAKAKRMSLGLRRQKLPPYPPIETVDTLDLKNFLASNFRTVEYGGNKYQECLEGYVHVYATGYRYPRSSKAIATYSVWTKTSIICICVDEMWVISFLAQHLPEMSDNAFRSVFTVKLSTDLETNMAIHVAIRSRQDLKFRLKYVPIKIGFADMMFARKYAVKSAKNAEHQQRLESIVD